MQDEKRKAIGPWTLDEQLGKGGNATVWKATRSKAEGPVALKVVNSNKIHREPYQRFVKEIGFLQQTQSIQGLLPLLDAYLPDEPSNTDQAWLAMPIATPISEALVTRELPVVVEAIAQIAGTLANLERELDIAHRDIKPGNLYQLEGQWLIGDFGLIAMPDSSGLTQQGRPLGPAHYSAYELINDPTNADPHAADVYSLGKTLWVLATGQAYPPPGHQPAGTRGFEVGDYRPHTHAAALDREIALMTYLHAEQRPLKAQVASDLTAWGLLPATQAAFDASEAKATIRAKLLPEIVKQGAEAEQKELAYAAVRKLQELTEPLNAVLKDLTPRTQVDLESDRGTQNLLTSCGAMGGPIQIFRWQRCTVVKPSDEGRELTLKMSRSLELVEGGDLHLHLMVFVGPERTIGSSFTWHPAVAIAPIGGIAVEQMLHDGVRKMTMALGEAVKVLANTLPDPV